MDNVLLKLKSILNGLTDEELKEYDLSINRDTSVELIAIEERTITLVTRKANLKFDDLEW